MAHWLVKSEPDVYSWDKFKTEKKAVWDGVRNFTARNNLRAMKKGDLVLFYHSNEGKEVVGIATVSKEAFADPSAKDGDWSAVEITPKKALKAPVTLAQIKADKKLQGFALIKLSRLSVVPATPEQFARVLELSEAAPAAERGAEKQQPKKAVKKGVKGPKKGEGQASGEAASAFIDERIREVGGWRGETLARMRALILEADPAMIEEWKWGTPVWSQGGIVCTGETYKQVVKLTFAQGAKLPDPSQLFNSSLGGNMRRAIDIHEDEQLDARAFKALVKAAVSANSAKKR